jgi:hypothetical protein
MRTTILLTVLLMSGIQQRSGHAACNEQDRPTSRYFAIEVVDAATGRGVPLVELETVDHQKFVTDSSGLIAVDEPDLLGQSVFFHVRSHGYEFAKDGFGIAGKALNVRSGGRERLELKRLNIAERLYRITGAGIYRDTVLLGREPPIREPLLAGKVVGCDSVLAAPYRGRIYWFWGDTLRPSYPLGNFHTTGATTPLVGQPQGPDPERGFNFDYFTGTDGFVRPMAEVPGDGPTWIGALTVLKEDDGQERMYASYVKIRPPLTPYEHGLVVWDDAAARFKKLVTFDDATPINLEPQLHTFQHTDSDGKRYVYFTGSFPWVRVPANHESLMDPTLYEGFSCLQPGAELKEQKLDRDADGRLRYSWKRATAPVHPQEEAKLIAAGKLKPGEAISALRDVDTGRTIIPHKGSVYWNEYRRHWVLIVSELGGESSHLGEIWYAEAPAPEGPWVYGRKIVTHERYSFYNPTQHPFFDRDDGRLIYFEGTYTRDFSGNPVATPRYEYNQLMYKLDLADPRLNLPGPIFQEQIGGPASAERQIAFFALRRESPSSIPVYAVGNGDVRKLALAKPQGPRQQPVFFALPTTMQNPPSTTTLLYELTGGGQQRRYSTADQLPASRRVGEPLCRVWRNPIDASFRWREEHGESIGSGGAQR